MTFLAMCHARPRRLMLFTSSMYFQDLLYYQDLSSSQNRVMPSVVIPTSTAIAQMEHGRLPS